MCVFVVGQSLAQSETDLVIAPVEQPVAKTLWVNTVLHTIDRNGRWDIVEDLIYAHSIVMDQNFLSDWYKGPGNLSVVRPVEYSLLLKSYQDNNSKLELAHALSGSLQHSGMDMLETWAPSPADKVISSGRIVFDLLAFSSNDMELFIDDVFRYQRNTWSRYEYQEVAKVLLGDLYDVANSDAEVSVDVNAWFKNGPFAPFGTPPTLSFDEIIDREVSPALKALLRNSSSENEPIDRRDSLNQQTLDELQVVLEKAVRNGMTEASSPNSDGNYWQLEDFQEARGAVLLISLISDESMDEGLQALDLLFQIPEALNEVEESDFSISSLSYVGLIVYAISALSSKEESPSVNSINFQTLQMIENRLENIEINLDYMHSDVANSIHILKGELRKLIRIQASGHEETRYRLLEIRRTLYELAINLDDISGQVQRIERTLVANHFANFQMRYDAVKRNCLGQAGILAPQNHAENRDTRFLRQACFQPIINYALDGSNAPFISVDANRELSATQEIIFAGPREFETIAFGRVFLGPFAKEVGLPQIFATGGDTFLAVALNSGEEGFKLALEQLPLLNARLAQYRVFLETLLDNSTANIVFENYSSSFTKHLNEYRRKIDQLSFRNGQLVLDKSELEVIASIGGKSQFYIDQEPLFQAIDLPFSRDEFAKLRMPTLNEFIGLLKQTTMDNDELIQLWGQWNVAYVDEVEAKIVDDLRSTRTKSVTTHIYEKDGKKIKGQFRANIEFPTQTASGIAHPTVKQDKTYDTVRVETTNVAISYAPSAREDLRPSYLGIFGPLDTFKYLTRLGVLSSNPLAADMIEDSTDFYRRHSVSNTETSWRTTCIVTQVEYKDSYDENIVVVLNPNAHQLCLTDMELQKIDVRAKESTQVMKERVDACLRHVVGGLEPKDLALPDKILKSGYTPQEYASPRGNLACLDFFSLPRHLDPIGIYVLPTDWVEYDFMCSTASNKQRNPACLTAFEKYVSNQDNFINSIDEESTQNLKIILDRLIFEELPNEISHLYENDQEFNASAQSLDYWASALKVILRESIRYSVNYGLTSNQLITPISSQDFLNDLPKNLRDNIGIDGIDLGLYGYEQEYLSSLKSFVHLLTQQNSRLLESGNHDPLILFDELKGIEKRLNSLKNLAE